MSRALNDFNIGQPQEKSYLNNAIVFNIQNLQNIVAFTLSRCTLQNVEVGTELESRFHKSKHLKLRHGSHDERKKYVESVILCDELHKRGTIHNNESRIS